MNFEDLKSQWTAQNAKLDRVLQLNATAVREIRMGRARSRLRWLVPGIVFELAMAFVAVVWLGDFIAGHLGEPRFFLPAVLLDVCAIALLGACIRQLAVIGALDYGGPVVAVQKELEKLRILRIRTTKWTMALSFVLWFPILIVLVEGLLGVDPWLILGAIRDREASFLTWIVANVLFGVAVALGMIWVSKRYADRFDRSPFMRRLMDDLAGRSLTEALGSLDSIARFGAELGADPDLALRAR